MDNVFMRVRLARCRRPVSVALELQKLRDSSSVNRPTAGSPTSLSVPTKRRLSRVIRSRCLSPASVTFVLLSAISSSFVSPARCASPASVIRSLYDRARAFRAGIVASLARPALVIGVCRTSRRSSRRSAAMWSRPASVMPVLERMTPRSFGNAFRWARSASVTFLDSRSRISTSTLSWSAILVSPCTTTLARSFMQNSRAARSAALRSAPEALGAAASQMTETSTPASRRTGSGIRIAFAPFVLSHRSHALHGHR